MLRPTSTQKSPLMVPGAELRGLVSPSIFLPVETTALPSQTMQTTGPDSMYWISLGKKGFWARSSQCCLSMSSLGRVCLRALRAKPLFSNRLMISPTSPLWTPSGLIMMQVLSFDIVEDIILLNIRICILVSSSHYNQQKLSYLTKVSSHFVLLAGSFIFVGKSKNILDNLIRRRTASNDNKKIKVLAIYNHNINFPVSATTLAARPPVCATRGVTALAPMIWTLVAAAEAAEATELETTAATEPATTTAAMALITGTNTSTFDSCWMLVYSLAPVSLKAIENKLPSGEILRPTEEPLGMLNSSVTKSVSPLANFSTSITQRNVELSSSSRTMRVLLGLSLASMTFLWKSWSLRKVYSLLAFRSQMRTLLDPTGRTIRQVPLGPTSIDFCTASY